MILKNIKIYSDIGIVGFKTYFFITYYKTHMKFNCDICGKRGICNNLEDNTLSAAILHLTKHYLAGELEKFK